MIATIIIWIYITFLSFIYGLIFIKILNGIFKFEQSQHPHFSLICITGLCLIAAIIGYFSLFIKIGLIANVILFTIGIAFLIIKFKDIVDLLSTYRRQIKDTNKFILLLFLIILLYTLIQTTDYADYAKHYDTGLYYAQAIRWIEEYRVIPGLGNLHRRLANNSTWFLLHALFSLSFLKLQSFHVLNGIFYIIGALFLFNGVNEFLKGKHTQTNIIKTVILVTSMYACKKWLSAPTPDLPVILLTWISFILFLDKIENGKYYKFDITSVLIVVMSVFAFAIKLSGLLIFLLPVYIIYSVFLKNKKSETFIFMAVILIIIAPLFIRSTIISGYLLYPLRLDIFDFDWKMPLHRVFFDWKMPLHMVINDIQLGIGDARIPSAFPNRLVYPLRLVLNMSFTEWVPIWFMYLRPLFKITLLLTLFASLYYLVHIFLNIKKLPFYLKNYKDYIILYLTAYCSAFFWFIIAPSWRYGLGIITMLCLLLIVPILKPLITSLTRTLSILILVACIFYPGAKLYLRCLQNPLIAVRRIKNVSERIVFPRGYKVVETKEVKAKNFVINIPIAGNRCWYAPLPCAPKAMPKLELRGDTIEDGFRISNS